MADSDRLIEGQSFYQSEPLIARLRGIIRDYPEGVGILKELIQNADDAKATRVEITLDWRTHSFTSLPDDRMVQLMGPAMLVYNNQVFADRDFDSIRHLGQSEKAQDLQKTGRFGVGFNAIYHVTDFPSFISRRSLIFFDPHAWAIPGTSRQEPGREWNFATAGWYDKYPDFMKVYAAGGLPFGVEDFQGTLFRLPLRTEAQAQKSEIRKQPFTEDNVRELLQEFIESGEELLLFLKSVQEIHVYEIPAGSDGSRKEILKIVTQNQEEVATARQTLLSSLPDEPDTLLKLCHDNPRGIASVSYRHEIETVTPEKTIASTWRVVSVIRTDEAGELARVIEAMQQNQEKVVPWAGAAARIKTSIAQPVKGKVYCFLPLPLESALPIHINGFFNLNSSRDNLSSDSGQTGKDRPRAIWNQLLVRHVLSHACANLITDLVEDIGKDNPEEFYKLFPTQKITVAKALEELHADILKLLYSKPVVCSTVDRTWITPQTIKVLSHEWWKKLVLPLRSDRINIADPPLLGYILSAFKSAGCEIATFKPADLRKHLLTEKPLGVMLDNAPKASLRDRLWVVEMLRYCISDGYRDLRGLPLAILANNTLQVFGHNPIGTVYTADDSVREIFASYPEWFLHPNVSLQISFSNCTGVSHLNVTDVAKKLLYVTADESTWEPDSPHPPNANWLALVYRYFTNIRQRDLPLAELKEVPLVPGDDGKLHKGGNDETPLFCGEDIDAETIAAVKYFKVKLIQAPAVVEGAIAQFLDKHQDTLVWFLTGPDVVDTIYANTSQGLPVYDAKNYTTLLNFLAESRWLTGTRQYDSRLDKLRQLPIYLTNSNDLVSLTEENVYLPGDGYEAPEIAGNLRLLRLGSDKQEWLPLFKALEVPILNRARLIQDCLLSEYPSLSSSEQLIALTWIRDNLKKAQKELEKEGQNPAVLKEQIQNARLVRCADGRLRSANVIYSPASDIVRHILGNQAAFPDMEYYAPDSPEWLQFFESLGMQAKPSAEDLLACINTLTQKANISGADAVAESCLEVFNYILDNWEELKQATVNNGANQLIDILREKAWLPVERNPEKLKLYAAAITPENRLYRSQDVCFVQHAHLVASQQPIFAYSKKDLIRVEVRNRLGFQPIESKVVLSHFEATIKTGTTEVNENCLASVKAIYKYLYDSFIESRVTDEQREHIKQQFANYQCLWDESTGKFWKPINAFQDNVPFFGSRRVTIPFTHRTGEVYQLLGQKRSPAVEDYLDFLQELASEYNNSPLSEKDTSYALQVLQRLEAQLSLEARSLKSLLVLTENCQLRPTTEVFIPDAPWRKDYINPNCLLHPQVSVKLAKSSGSLSLLKDVIERPTQVDVALEGTIANEWCQQWQKTLNSAEFRLSLKRLIFHEWDTEPILDLNWLRTAKVLPTSQIQVDLLFKDENENLIASAIPGSYYFDGFKRGFHLISSNSKLIMLSYLAESLNHQIGEYALKNLLPLASVIDAEPKTVNGLLNELRIRSLSNQDTVSPEITNRDAWGKEQAKYFYRSLGYTEIIEQDEQAGFDLICQGLEHPEIKAIVKTLQASDRSLSIEEKQWSQLTQPGTSYDLIIIKHQNDTVEEVIQISHFWQTLNEAESVFKKQQFSSNISPKKDDEDNYLIAFSSTLGDSNNNLILNWHNFLNCVADEKIKRYYS